jgi:integrase/recombinase XerD
VTLDEDLLPWIAPSRVATLHELYARQDPQSAELVREVEDFQEQRAKLGYQTAAKAQHGARLLLRFLRARGRALQGVTRADFKDFSTHVLQDGGHCYTRPEPLLIGAAAYLRMKARAGVIGEDQVPKYERRRAVLLALPEALQEGLRVLGQAMQAGDFAATTRPTYRRALKGFFVWIHAEHGITTLGEVTRDVITAYRLHLQSEPSIKGEPYALHTQVGILTALRFFFGWLVKTGGLLSDPTVHLPYLRRPKHLPKAMKAAELARLIARQPRTLLGLRDRALLELLYGTGMRRSEVSRLRIDDVDLDERVILIRQGKGRKDRMVPLGKRAKAVLLEYLEEARPKLLRGDGGAFFVGRGGRLFSESAVTHRVIQLGRRLGLNLGPHVLRHSCATHLLRGRADIRHIQRLLGHESLATTERYTKVEVQDLRAVIQRCHPRERPPKA